MKYCIWTEIKEIGKYQTSCGKEFPNMKWEASCSSNGSEQLLSSIDFVCCPFCKNELTIGKHIIKQYDRFVLLQDINPVITKGFIGVVLEKYAPIKQKPGCAEDIEVEFVKTNGTNYTYCGVSTFCIDSSLINIIR